MEKEEEKKEHIPQLVEDELVNPLIELELIILKTPAATCPVPKRTQIEVKDNKESNKECLEFKRPLQIIKEQS